MSSKESIDPSPDPSSFSGNNEFTLYGQQYSGRFWMGTARFPSPMVLQQSAQAGHVGMLTVSLRREGITGQNNPQGKGGFLRHLQQMSIPLLPNTAGCKTVKEAMTTAYMARELLGTKRIKLEIITDEVTLCPDLLATVEATTLLIKDGFHVFPYITEDLSVAGRLLNTGCQVLMPWGSPIGTCRGLNNPFGLEQLRKHFADAFIVVDAGLGLPSQACQAMEKGLDAVLLNTAIAEAGDPVMLATAFGDAVQAGRMAYQANPPAERTIAIPSTPLMGLPYL